MPLPLSCAGSKVGQGRPDSFYPQYSRQRINRSVYRLCMLPGELEVGSTPFAGQDVHHGTLHIRGVQKVDAGQYTCVASSPAGTATGTVSLKVGGESELQRAHTEPTPPSDCAQSRIFPCFHRGPIVL